MISDRVQRQGLGEALLSRLIQIGRDEKTSRIFGMILPENVAMRRICEKLGFRLDTAPRFGDPRRNQSLKIILTTMRSAVGYSCWMLMKGIQTFRLRWPRHAVPHERILFPARPKAGHSGSLLTG